MDDMDELYYQVPYVKEFEAKVLACREGKKGFEVVLDQTAFYPEGGGQLGDRGMLNGVKVFDTRHDKEGAIIHCTEKPLEVGSWVRGVLDWQTRFDHMQAHSGEHIVSGLMHKHFGYDNVGFHMAPDRVTVDFSGPVTPEQLAEIEHEANECIWNNVPVQVEFPSADELKSLEYRSKKELSGRVRIVTFPSADCCACCGTHVQRTGEIGAIKMLSMTNYKGGVRIEMLCGRLALEDYGRKNAQQTELCRLFSAKPYELADAVKQYMAAQDAQSARIMELARKYFELRTGDFPMGQGVVVVFEEGFKPAELRKFCDGLVTSGRAKVAAVLTDTVNNGRKGWSYVICSREVNLRDAVKELNRKLNGRGGGDSTLVQGSFFAPREEIEAELKSLQI